MGARSMILEKHAVRIMGHGDRAMVLAHGFGCDQQMWRFVAPAFEETHRLVLFDHVGSGRSDLRAYDPVHHGSLHGYAADVIELCDALGLREVVFVGHSVSATIGALAAIAAPSRFASLVMIAPSPRFVDDPPAYVGGFARSDIDELLAALDQNYVTWAGLLGPLVMGNADRPELAAELVTSLCASDPVITRRFAEVTFTADHRDDLPKVPVPTLVLQCARDALAPVAVGRYVAERLPRATLEVLDVSGHCPHLTHPRETNAAIAAFVKGATSGRDA